MRRGAVAKLGGFASLLLLAACRPAAPPPPRAPGPPPPIVAMETPPATASTPVEARAVQLGALEGFIRLAGDTIPLPTMIENTTDPEVCGRMHTLEDLLVSSDTRGIRNVVIALKDPPASAFPSAAPRRLTLDNRECRFVPHVSVLTVGDTIEAVNGDMTMHTVHFYGPLTANLALPTRGARLERRVQRPGTIIVKCDVHGWMQAYIRVDRHPLHAVTDENGRFRIAGIPPGEHELEIWHEKLGPRTMTVRIEPGATETIEVTYSLDKPQSFSKEAIR